MTTKKVEANYSPEVRERAVRLVLEGGGGHPTRWAAVASVAAKIGCTAETLRKRVRQAERDGGPSLAACGGARRSPPALDGLIGQPGRRAAAPAQAGV